MHKAVNVMNMQATTQHNKCIYLENPMVMYGTYNAETSENLLNTVHSMHNSTTEIKRLFAGELNAAHTLYIDVPNTQEYTID